MKFNKFVSSGLLFVFMVLGATPVHAEQYTIDDTHAFIEFRVKHLGFSWLLGRFNKLEGEFNYDPAKGEGAQNVTVTVFTDSLDSNHAERDKHLRNILGVSDFETAHFESTGYTGDENGGVMAGNLTIHGVTKDVEIEVTKVGEGADPWGGYRAGFEGKLNLNRKDYGVDFELGPHSWDVELSLYIEGVRN